MEVQEKLTPENLLQYHEHWMRIVGPHRNEEDMRFGQWIWILYNKQLSEAREKIEGSDKYLDGFHTESPDTAYTQILKLIS
jgi:hypothetical protein